MIKPVEEGQAIADAIVAPSCDENKGMWMCVTHTMTFHNNISKDQHCMAGTDDHFLAWVCYSHGPEVP